MEILKNYRTEHRTSIVNLNRENQIVKFCDDGNASSMFMLTQKHWQLKEVLKAHCSECGDIHLVSDMFPGNVYGDGGIAYSAHDLYCEDFYYMLSDEGDDDDEY
jgi:hypothetical protein